MRFVGKLGAVGAVVAAGGPVWAQEEGQAVGVHGGIALSYVAFFALASIVVYLVFKGNQNR